MTIDVIFTALLPQTIDQKMSFTFFTQSKFKPSKSRAVQVSWPPPNRDESTPTPTGVTFKEEYLFLANTPTIAGWSFSYAIDHYSFDHQSLSKSQSATLNFWSPKYQIVQRYLFCTRTRWQKSSFICIEYELILISSFREWKAWFNYYWFCL